ncbi:hypothetical protein L1987_08787 [Smallanthus sonchifolius]|uniref:Uncharacterized protein n=1 Tax=Smallanthus sonchifolius TaxID=185202 RepID=A0ACB9JM50_9ASTR|nr:hypothetical protein L1987_08787 [Smallanthus sonchifolius]
MIRVAIGGKSKAFLNHLTQDPPKTTDEEYDRWEQDDLIIFSWLIQNIEPSLASNLTEFPTAKTLWEALTVTYSSGKYKLQTFDLHVKANEFKQNGVTLEELWIVMQGIWGEIERRDLNPMTCPTDIATYNKVRSENKLFHFFNALDRKYDPIKREILRWDPLPSAEAAYAAVRKETAHQNIFDNFQQGVASGLSSDGLGLVSKGRRSDQKFSQSSSRIDKTKLKCDHCGMTKHTKEQCFKLVGYPEWWADGQKKGKTAATVGSQVTTSSGGGNSRGGGNQAGKDEGGAGFLATVEGMENGGADTSIGFEFFSSNPSLSKKTPLHPHSSNISISNPKFFSPKFFDLLNETQDTEMTENPSQDIRTGMIIGRGTERQGLYYVDEVTREEKRIIHQTSCAHTPEQNGVSERKNRFLLEITRALIIESKVPKKIWPEALVTTTYLVNRLPTRALDLKTPLQTLSKFHKPPSTLTLEPRVFGCSVFVHLPKIERSKPDPCAEKCVFIGYGINQQGYRCYSPKKHHMFTTMNCDFLETEYFYNDQHTGQGENEYNDTASWLKWMPSSEEVNHSTETGSPS